MRKNEFTCDFNEVLFLLFYVFGLILFVIFIITKTNILWNGWFLGKRTIIINFFMSSFAMDVFFFIAEKIEPDTITACMLSRKKKCECVLVIFMWILDLFEKHKMHLKPTISSTDKFSSAFPKKIVDFIEVAIWEIPEAFPDHSFDFLWSWMVFFRF